MNTKNTTRVPLSSAFLPYSKLPPPNPKTPLVIPKPPNKFIQLVNTKGGSLICLIVVAIVLAFGQTNLATPFKYVLFRNVMIALAINWWRFRGVKKNDYDIDLSPL